MSRLFTKDRKMIETFTNLLTTFAKTKLVTILFMPIHISNIRNISIIFILSSDPNFEGMNVNWKPTRPERPSHLIINETLEVADRVLNGERMEFWHKLKRKFQKQCTNS